MKLENWTERSMVVKERGKQRKPPDIILEFLVFFVLSAGLKNSLLLIKNECLISPYPQRERVRKHLFKGS